MMLKIRDNQQIDEFSDLILNVADVSENNAKEAFKKYYDNHECDEEKLKKLHEKAVTLYTSYQYKEAEEAFFAYHIACPVDHRGLGGLIAISLEKEDFFSALELLEEYKKFPTIDLDETFLNVSFCHLKLGYKDQAQAFLLFVNKKNLSEFNTKRYETIEKESILENHEGESL